MQNQTVCQIHGSRTLANATQRITSTIDDPLHVMDAMARVHKQATIDTGCTASCQTIEQAKRIHQQHNLTTWRLAHHTAHSTRISATTHVPVVSFQVVAPLGALPFGRLCRLATAPATASCAEAPALATASCAGAAALAAAAPASLTALLAAAAAALTAGTACSAALCTAAAAPAAAAAILSVAVLASALASALVSALASFLGACCAERVHATARCQQLLCNQSSLRTPCELLLEKLCSKICSKHLLSWHSLGDGLLASCCFLLSHRLSGGFSSCSWRSSV
jgi:hypothetical protein